MFWKITYKDEDNKEFDLFFGNKTTKDDVEKRLDKMKEFGWQILNVRRTQAIK